MQGHGDHSGPRPHRATGSMALSNSQQPVKQHVNRASNNPFQAEVLCSGNDAMLAEDLT
jgi:hypothetical protein